jgi:hypothetical protein
LTRSPISSARCFSNAISAGLESAGNQRIPANTDLCGPGKNEQESEGHTLSQLSAGESDGSQFLSALRKEEAWQMLAEIYGWFTEGFDTKDLQEAKALLDELT